MIDASAEGATKRLKAVQRRSEEAAQSVLVKRGSDGKPARLLSEIRAYLEDAYDKGHIREAPDVVLGLVQMTKPLPDPKKPGVQRVVIALGRKANFDNVAGTPRLTRADDAWFDFRLILRLEGNSTTLYSYAFALRIPDNRDVRQVRVDLNAPGHDNENLGLRSHVHLNVDDEGFSIPSPIMSPVEVLDVMLFSLRPGDGKQRAASHAPAAGRP